MEQVGYSYVLVVSLEIGQKKKNPHEEKSSINPIRQFYLLNIQKLTTTEMEVLQQSITKHARSTFSKIEYKKVNWL